MTIWKYEEKNLVKLYKEDHGEGEFIGDLDEATIRAMILEIKPNIKIDQAYGTLDYFGMLPILISKKSQSN